MKHLWTPLALIAPLLLASAATAQDDTRELVKLPEMMQQHMMSNMRDHLLALDEILGLLAEGKNTQAGELAEQRIGMSSLTLHGADHMGPYMPEGMRAAGTEMHRRASRFALAAQEAELDQTYEAQQKVFAALQGITENCNACHMGYRLR
ncbi:hypothetical protein [Magnetospira sp. QH-2]|uniref:hypothetical protein n=1 Tax=Magnetospira sp. (strain QH-2) TaxID=1288970 RepID=UPI0003E813CA|nr:hypothetical protein [Magnetospira sp. QH-2]CCQ75415.1 conserved exported protein of unknown function [Magnetospira sp. QH-2]